MENTDMIEKEYDGMLLDAIKSLDRIAMVTKDTTTLKAIHKERNDYIDKLGHPVDEHGLYDMINQ